jgi:hypothetical protein
MRRWRKLWQTFIGSAAMKGGNLNLYVMGIPVFMIYGRTLLTDGLTK